MESEKRNKEIFCDATGCEYVAIDKCDICENFFCLQHRANSRIHCFDCAEAESLHHLNLSDGNVEDVKKWVYSKPLTIKLLAATIFITCCAFIGVYRLIENDYLAAGIIIGFIAGLACLFFSIALITSWVIANGAKKGLEGFERDLKSLRGYKRVMNSKSSNKKSHPYYALLVEV